jgi:hypothetical protein
LGLGIALGASCGSDDAGQTEAAATEARFRSVWDFAYIYPEPETEADVKALLSIDDIGLEPAMLAAMLGHAMNDVPLPGAAPDDTVLRPGTSELTVFHEECLRDPSRWRVSQVRFAPYEMGVPGTVTAYADYAAARGGDLRRVMHVRLTLHNFCGSEGFILREDQAFHLIYALRPDDEGLARGIFDQAAQFSALQVGASPDRSASYQALGQHFDALNSEAYGEFRQRVLRDFAALAALVPREASFAASDEEAQNFRDGLVGHFDDKFRYPNPDFAKARPSHPALGQGGAVRDGLAALVKRYAVPANLVKIAAMFTEGEQDAEDFRWFFSLMAPRGDVSLASLGPEAKEIYGRVTPLPLDTFVAVLGADGVDVTRVTSAGFYSESRGVITGPERLPSSAAIRAEVDRVDYVDFPVPAAPEDGGLDGMAAIPSGDTLRGAMERFTDVAVANASTTPCDRCHNMDNIERHDSPNGYRQSEQTADAYNFHAIAPGKINLRTVREIDDEIGRANAELARGETTSGGSTSSR